MKRSSYGAFFFGNDFTEGERKRERRLSVEDENEVEI
jgi:hypothetical protein